jgi:hypothetical protein
LGRPVGGRPKGPSHHTHDCRERCVPHKRTACDIPHFHIPARDRTDHGYVNTGPAVRYFERAAGSAFKGGARFFSSVATTQNSGLQGLRVVLRWDPRFPADSRAGMGGTEAATTPLSTPRTPGFLHDRPSVAATPAAVPSHARRLRRHHARDASARSARRSAPCEARLHDSLFQKAGSAVAASIDERRHRCCAGGRSREAGRIRFGRQD